MDGRGLLLLRSAARAYQMGRWEEAVELYGRSRLYARDPELVAQANNGYAWTLVDKLNRDLDAAEKGSLVAVQADPKSSAIADTLAWIYYKQGRFQEALTTQQRAIELMQREAFADAPSRAEIHYHLGAIQEKLGDKADAIANYKFALAQGAPCPPAADALERLSPPPTQPNVPAPDPSGPAVPVDPAVSRGII
jgi:tetratricopeptide (TPR) repeat protein